MLFQQHSLRREYCSMKRKKYMEKRNIKNYFYIYGCLLKIPDKPEMSTQINIKVITFTENNAQVR